MYKKSISILLALLILISAIPLSGMTAFAVTNDADAKGTAAVGAEEDDVTSPEHTLVFYPIVPATKTEPGSKAYYQCSECGKLFKDSTGLIEITDPSKLIIPVQVDSEFIEPTEPPEPEADYYVEPSYRSNGTDTVAIARFYPGTFYFAAEEIRIGAYADRHFGKEFTGNKVTEIDADAMSSLDSRIKRAYIPITVMLIGENALGYFRNESGEKEKIEDFTIYGFRNSAAQRYAEANNFTFVPADPEPTTQEPTVAPTEGKKVYLGDADGDGEVTVLDATWIQRKIATLPVNSGFNEAAADVDGNGSVEVLDATWIQRKIATLPVKYPIGETM